MGNDINNYKTINGSDYHDCIGVVEHAYSINGVVAKIRMHYIKFDGNGRPMIKALANTLYGYIIEYCIASRNRSDALTAKQAAQLTKQARELFRHPKVTDESPDKTGEAGEILLYFLMEAVLNAPQIVSKMELKTNHKDEVKGSDGIHARYNESDGVVDFFFGESKLYADAATAIARAIDSVDQFHETEMYQHEFTMVTKHFKYANEKTKEAITSLIVSGEPGAGVRLNHACLIGYNFKEFSSLPVGQSREILMDTFIDLFHKDGKRLTDLLQNRFNSFNKKYLVFDVFFMPFPSVRDFRNAFNAALD